MSEEMVPNETQSVLEEGNTASEEIKETAAPEKQEEQRILCQKK